MGFQEVEKQVVRAVVGGGVADGAVGYFDLADALDQAHIGAVAGEVKEVAGAVQSPQVFRPHIPLQAVEGERAYAAHVHPGPDHGESVRIPQLGDGFVYFKSSYSHIPIMPY